MATVYKPSPVIGYHEGLVVSDVSPQRSVKGNLYFVIDGEAYDVHPYREDLGGYPVRWRDPIDWYRKQGY